MLEVTDNRAATVRLRWLTLHAPDLARRARPGHYLLLRASERPDPALPRALLIAAASEPLGQLALLLDPLADPGLVAIGRARPGDALDLIALRGQPINLDRKSRTLLLIGGGPGVAALLLLAAQATARGVAVTLLLTDPDPAAHPPPFLLPAEVEYRTDLLLTPGAPSAALRDQIGWADQLVAALPTAQIAALRDAVRATKLRWERGFATVIPAVPLPCDTAACGACAVALRRSLALSCVDGPAFDLRDLDLG